MTTPFIVSDLVFYRSEHPHTQPPTIQSHPERFPSISLSTHHSNFHMTQNLSQLRTRYKLVLGPFALRVIVVFIISSARLLCLADDRVLESATRQLDNVVFSSFHIGQNLRLLDAGSVRSPLRRCAFAGSDRYRRPSRSTIVVVLLRGCVVARRGVCFPTRLRRRRWLLVMTGRRLPPVGRLPGPGVANFRSLILFRFVRCRICCLRCI